MRSPGDLNTPADALAGTAGKSATPKPSLAPPAMSSPTGLTPVRKNPRSRGRCRPFCSATVVIPCGGEFGALMAPVAPPLPLERPQPVPLLLRECRRVAVDEPIDRCVARYKRRFVRLDGHAPKQREVRLNLRELARAAWAVDSRHDAEAAVHHQSRLPVGRLERRPNQGGVVVLRLYSKAVRIGHGAQDAVGRRHLLAGKRRKREHPLAKLCPGAAVVRHLHGIEWRPDRLRVQARLVEPDARQCQLLVRVDQHVGGLI